MEGEAADECAAVSILDVLRVDLCARAILGHVPVKDLVRSERVCKCWQQAVHHYLQGCRGLGFYDVEFNDRHWLRDIHRNISISPTKRSLQYACNILKKLGMYIVEVTTERSEEEYFEVIASNCLHLRKLDIDIKDEHYQLNHIKKVKQLKHVAINFHGIDYSEVDRGLAEAFQGIDCEQISMECYWAEADLTGSFLNSVKFNNFKSLRIKACSCVSVMITNLLSAIHNLQNLTVLILDSCGKIPRNMNLLLDKLPLLEEFSLQNYEKEILSEESIESMSRLMNLKRLNMNWNYCVNDALLEAVAKRCKKLEYVNIRRCITMYDDRCRRVSRVTARGVAALCCRSPSAVTNIDYRYTVVNSEAAPSRQDFIAHIESIVDTEAYYNAQGDWRPDLPESEEKFQSRDPRPRLTLILFAKDHFP